MSLKSTIESHPIWYLVVVAVAAGSVVFGVTQYFHNQDIARKDHKIEDLESNLGGIQRRVGIEPLFLDILEVQIESSKVSNLPTRYERFDGEVTFFVDTPVDDTWSSSAISLAEADQIIFGIGTTSNPLVNQNLRDEKIVTAWKSDYFLK